MSETTKRQGQLSQGLYQDEIQAGGKQFNTTQVRNIVLSSIGVDPEVPLPVLAAVWFGNRSAHYQVVCFPSLPDVSRESQHVLLAATLRSYALGTTPRGDYSPGTLHPALEWQTPLPGTAGEIYHDILQHEMKNLLGVDPEKTLPIYACVWHGPTSIAVFNILSGFDYDLGLVGLQLQTLASRLSDMATFERETSWNQQVAEGLQQQMARQRATAGLVIPGGGPIPPKRGA